MSSLLKERLHAVEGWQGRIGTKLTVAGGLGVVVGSMLAILNNVPLAKHTATSTLSFVLVMGCFAALQEGGRFLRGRDDAVNGALAGAGTGTFLFKLHGGNPVRGAAVCAALGGAAAWAGGRVDLSQGLRQAFISLDLLDDDVHDADDSAPRGHDEAAAAAAASPLLETGGEEGRGWLEWASSYLPIRKMSDEEWEEYQRKQEQAQQRRVQAALEGGLPAIVERKHANGQEQQQEPCQ